MGRNLPRPAFVAGSRAFSFVQLSGGWTDREYGSASAAPPLRQQLVLRISSTWIVVAEHDSGCGWRART